MCQIDPGLVPPNLYFHLGMQGESLQLPRPVMVQKGVGSVQTRSINHEPDAVDAVIGTDSNMLGSWIRHASRHAADGNVKAQQRRLQERNLGGRVGTQT